MGSALVYVVVVGVVAGAVYLVAALVFGRGEELAPMPPGATPTRLPARDLTGGDVRDLRFQQTVRGYKCSEVDWALERLAAEVDALRARLDVVAAARPGEPGPADVEDPTGPTDPGRGGTRFGPAGTAPASAPYAPASPPSGPLPASRSRGEPTGSGSDTFPGTSTHRESGTSPWGKQPRDTGGRPGP